MRRGIGLVVLALALTAAPASAQQRFALLSFESVTLTTQQVLLGEKGGKPVTLTGELRFPAGAAGRVPVVILMHGLGGLSTNHDDWARALNEWGIAAFMVDSLSGRGIVGLTGGDYQLSALARMVDAYRALGMLAQHPRIEPDRIAVMGFSAGTAAAVFSASERFSASYGPPGAQFAAHFCLYANCMTRFRDDAKVVARPIRMFYGTADDWTPVEPCRALIADMRKGGADATLTEYAGATHVYDLPMKGRVTLPQATTARKCSLAEGEGGQVLNTKTGQAFTMSDPCLERGVTLQYDEAATTATREAVRTLLASLFPAKPLAGPGPAAKDGAPVK